MDPSIDKALRNLLNDSLNELEQALNSDVLSYYGPIVDGQENAVLNIVEDLAKDPNKKEQLAVILTTTGGSAAAVERYVNIIRHHYSKVIFIVPDYAYSAGTIFCMSGDDIWMDYFSVLGPIDPQVKNKEGNFVPALGYLDKINELIKKAQNNQLTNAEFVILKDFDLAELKGYEQAKELTISLLTKWLVKYKFKNWNIHNSTGNAVSTKEKEKRAEEIAANLGDNNKWKSHGRPINIEELQALKLKITDYSEKGERDQIRNYYKLIRDFISRYNFQIFIHTRKYL
ncbi:MAG: serine dehydrogenasease [Bacteroidaceae bacterium]|nr:serine dehydrogenasease [Bacteroidaceae bacterium]